MPREKRRVLPGAPHHISQRGNNRQTVFRSADRLFYLNTLNRKCRQHSLRILGYCLTTNHIHLVAMAESLRLPPAHVAAA